jgi:hypothetical protein
MIKIKLFLFSSIFLALTISACDSTNTVTDLPQKFMYPQAPEPYVYVFQDSLDPVFEMFERIITYYDPLGNHLLIERYNSSFALVESYDLLYDKDYQVFNHSLFVGQTQILAQVSDSIFVPWTGSGVFSSSFQGTSDSIMFVMRNKRYMKDERGSFLWDGKKVQTLQMVDSISTVAIDLKNKREKPGSAVAIHEFAEGLGRVRIKTLDGNSNLVLKRILTESEWKKLVTK